MAYCVQNRRSDAGFSLIELTFVTVIAGIMMSSLFVGTAYYLNSLKVKETRERFARLETVLSQYVQRHARLPCPAAPDGDGTEALLPGGGCLLNDSAAADGAAQMYAQTQGVVPWREIGVPQAMAQDGWGRLVTYKPAPYLTVRTDSAEMQDVADTVTADIHNACRTPLWFDRNGVHMDRAKALFCCNAAPKPDYLNAMGQDTVLAAGWRDQAVVAAGAVDNVTLAGLDATSAVPNAVPVVSTGSWMDDPANLRKNGKFTVVQHGATGSNTPDAALMRATGPAVTLVSHGGNGFFAFQPGQPQTMRLMAAVNLAAIAPAAGNVAPDDQANVWPPQVVAGAVYSPATANGRADVTGRRGGDDLSSYLRSDQIYALAGRATCVRPTPGGPSPAHPDCGDPSWKDVTYVLDTSASMRAKKFRCQDDMTQDCISVPCATEPGGFCNIHWATATIAQKMAAQRRIDMARNALNAIIPLHVQQEVLRDAAAPDRIGYNPFGQTMAQSCQAEHNNPADIFPVVNAADPAAWSASITDQVTASDAFLWSSTPVLTTIRASADAMALPDGSDPDLAPDGLPDSGNNNENNAIVVVSDGWDTCSGDPDIELDNLIAYLNANYPYLRVHVVDVEGNPKLQRLAAETGGKYVTAYGDRELRDSLLNIAAVCQ